MDKLIELENRIKQLETQNKPSDSDILVAVNRALLTGKLEIGGAGGTTTISALLALSSVSKGLLFPRMTSAQRDAIVSPQKGLVIYNTTTDVLNFYNGAWGAV